MRYEKHLLDRVATVEGYRVLSFLDEVERRTILGVNPVFQDSVHDLSVRELSAQLSGLCDSVAKQLELPFSTVLKKIDDNENCWILKYLYLMKPERIANIMAPHFMAPSKRVGVSKRDMEESFARWGLCPTDNCGRVDFFVSYFRGDIVDVEFYSASCYMLKAGVPYFPDGANAITSRVMSTREPRGWEQRRLTWRNSWRYSRKRWPGYSFVF